eukprot:SAG31_NODE_46524_length_254_cov_0.664516_2_plen_47_part_01
MSIRKVAVDSNAFSCVIKNDKVEAIQPKQGFKVTLCDETITEYWSKF